MIAEYARYMKGGYSIPELMKLKRRDFMFWYRIKERQIVEEIIINDCYKKNNNVPSGVAMKNRVDNYIKKKREEINQ